MLRGCTLNWPGFSEEFFKRHNMLVLCYPPPQALYLNFSLEQPAVIDFFFFLYFCFYKFNAIESSFLPLHVFPLKTSSNEHDLGKLASLKTLKLSVAKSRRRAWSAILMQTVFQLPACISNSIRVGPLRSKFRALKSFLSWKADAVIILGLFCSCSNIVNRWTSCPHAQISDGICLSLGWFQGFTDYAYTTLFKWAHRNQIKETFGYLGFVDDSL